MGTPQEVSKMIAQAAKLFDPPPSQRSALPNRNRGNAFTTLMSSHKRPSSKPKKMRPPPSTTPSSDPARATRSLGRDGLGAYIADPTLFPASRVIYQDEKWVVINDLFPKATIHLLLLPRDPQKFLLHPFDAFEDPVFLAEVQVQVRKFREVAAKELKRWYGSESKKEMAREKALEAAEEDAAAAVPEGRDWSQDIISGIHAGPSMNHLHVHILSRDRYSECMRHRKHYNSFATPFLVDVEDFPLGADDPRRYSRREGYLERDLVCWRCGRDFGHRFAEFKEHLGQEFQSWMEE